MFLKTTKVESMNRKEIAQKVLDQACTAKAGFDYSRFSVGEQRVLGPALEAAGFKVICWRDGERDSFGPLSRFCKVQDLETKQEFEISYG